MERPRVIRGGAPAAPESASTGALSGREGAQRPHPNHHADDDPHGDEHREHPQEESSLAHGEPWELRPIEEYSDAAKSPGQDVGGFSTLEWASRAGARPIAVGGHAVRVPDHVDVQSRVTLSRRAGFVVAAAAAFVAIASNVSVASSGASEVYSLQVGDVVRVSGVPIGCKVIRRTEQPAGRFLDCRRAGPLAGTYGAVVGSRRLMVVKFRSGQSAQVVFTATQGGDSKTCRQSGKAAGE